jgi:hypothetical protein
MAADVVEMGNVSHGNALLVGRGQQACSIKLDIAMVTFVSGRRC